jgi:hypothetical protein
MIELTFRSDDGPVVVQVCAPVATPEGDWPWTVEVRLDGRPSTVVAWDLLGVLDGALYLLSGYLVGREGLDPPVVALPLKEPPGGVAQALREGLLAVLDVRGIACPEAAREQVAACDSPTLLRRLLARAKTAASVEEVFAVEPE